MQRVITSALNREVLQHWLAILLVLWFVLLSARFSLYLAQAVTGQLPAETVLALAGLKSVGFAVFAMPLALFLALLLVLGRWNHELESVALAASGFGPGGYLRAVWPSLLLIALLVLVLSLFVVPETARQGYSLRAQASQSLDSALWRPGRFVSLRDGRLLLFADSISADGETLNRVFVQSSNQDDQSLVFAAHARRQLDAQTGARYIVLEQGRRYDGKPGTTNYRVLVFDRYGIRLDAGHASVPFKWDAVPSLSLLHDPRAAARAELQERLSRPVSVVVLLLCAIVLARFIPGKGRYSGLFAGLLVFLLYFNLLGMARSWVAEGALSPVPGLWWVHPVPLLCVWIIDRWQRGWLYRGRRI